jgi:hypothetical protein
MSAGTLQPAVPAGQNSGTLDIAHATSEQLRAEIARCIKLTANELLYMAAIWQELKSRGENMISLKSGLMRWMPNIAADRLDPEIVVRYAGNQVLIEHLAKLSVYKQRLLLSDPQITIPRINETGVTAAIAPLADLTAREIRAAFSSEGRERSYEEKLEILESYDDPAPIPALAGELHIEKSGEYIVGPGVRVKIDAVLLALNKYYNIDVVDAIERAAREAWTEWERRDPDHAQAKGSRLPRDINTTTGRRRIF